MPPAGRDNQFPPHRDGGPDADLLAGNRPGQGFEGRGRQWYAQTGMAGNQRAELWMLVIMAGELLDVLRQAEHAAQHGLEGGFAARGRVAGDAAVPSLSSLSSLSMSSMSSSAVAMSAAK
jgi:hypothetical protein